MHTAMQYDWWIHVKIQPLSLQCWMQIMLQDFMLVLCVCLKFSLVGLCGRVEHHELHTPQLTLLFFLAEFHYEMLTPTM